MKMDARERFKRSLVEMAKAYLDHRRNLAVIVDVLRETAHELEQGVPPRLESTLHERLPRPAVEAEERVQGSEFRVSGSEADHP